MTSKANRRKGERTNLKAAVEAEKRREGQRAEKTEDQKAEKRIRDQKAEKRVEDQRAEKRFKSTKVMTKKIGHGAKSEMSIRKTRSPNLITARRGIKTRSLIKSRKRIQKEEMVRELGQSPKVRREVQSVGTDQVAETGKRVNLQSQKKRRKSEKKTGRGAGNAAGVSKDSITVKKRIKSEEDPGVGNMEEVAQTEVRPETHTGADAREVRAIVETTAKTGHLIERTEKLSARREGAAAAAQRVITIEGRVRRAQIPREELKAPPDPKTEEARLDQDQIVQKAKTDTTARGINRALVQALTATEPVTSRKYVFCFLFLLLNSAPILYPVYV